MSSSSSSPAPTPAIPDDDSPHPPSLPLPLSASLILTSLPRDASTALSTVSVSPNVPAKVTIRLVPLPRAPILRQKLFKISSANRFETVVGFLRKKLGVGREEGVFCYVNSVFAPGLDESVGGLWGCFKTDDQLIVAYSLVPAFG